MHPLKQKESLGAQLILTILPTMMAIAFEKTAEAVLVKWAHKKEKQEKRTNPDEAPRIFEGVDGNFYTIIDGIVFPCEIPGLVRVDEDEEEHGNCGHCNHQHPTENTGIVVKEKIVKKTNETPNKVKTHKKTK